MVQRTLSGMVFPSSNGFTGDCFVEISLGSNRRRKKKPLPDDGLSEMAQFPSPAEQQVLHDSIRSLRRDVFHFLLISDVARQCVFLSQRMSGRANRSTLHFAVMISIEHSARLHSLALPCKHRFLCLEGDNYYLLINHLYRESRGRTKIDESCILFWLITSNYQTRHLTPRSTHTLVSSPR